jgi:uncharacterized protein with HEPN domain
MRADRDLLADMLEAIGRIERYAARGREAFLNDELIQVWIIHHMQTIGEAARRLSRGLQAEHHAIPWSEIIAMRNILVHDYFGVDTDEIWSAVENDLPKLRRQIESILADAD